MKSREAVLSGVQTYNNPLTTFKTESFIVLVVVAWTYLLHAHYRRQGIDYRYFDAGTKRRRFHRTKSGAFRHWELERCLNVTACPLDNSTKSNLRFLIGLRHEIEHHQSAGVDDRLAGRYLACCLNYERVVTELFGPTYSLGSQLTFTLQFRDLFTVPDAQSDSGPALATNIARYIQDFDAALAEEEFQSPRFSYQLLFTRKLTSRVGQADKVIEFIPPDSPLAEAISKEYLHFKEVERPKYRPGDVVSLMNQEGYVKFRIHDHTTLWKALDARNSGKGFGHDVAGSWFWYDSWLQKVREHCATDSKKYGYSPPAAAAPT